MKKKKILALLCVAMTATTLMTGCGGSSSNEPVQGTVEAEAGETTGETQEAAKEEGRKEAGKPEEAGNRVMGKVTAVNGNEITIALVNMGGRPEGGNGERPEMPEGEEGKAPSDMSDMMEETGETKTIVIEDESIIVKFEGEEEVTGSLADIEVDSVISLTYDENETLTQVMIGFGGKK